MARRRKNDGFFDDLHEVFMQVPAWICVPLAIGAFLLIRGLVGGLSETNPLFKALAQNANLFGGLAALAVLLAGLAAALRKARRRKLYDEQSSIESIRALSWREFEMLIGEAFRRQGYEVIETGGGGADGGIDLVLHGRGGKTLVQCKQWKVYKVGVGPVRELFGVLMSEKADRAVFVTSGVYTQEAKNFASGKQLELIDGARLCQLIDLADKPQPGREARLATKTELVPQCPKCEGPMALRTAKKGANAGSQFWGCSTYPKCNGTRAVPK
jgi:restriction system protein